MNNDLYFITIIEEALRQSDPHESLKRAFDLIKSLGEKPRYQFGFKQFERFMAVVENRLNTGRAELGDSVTVGKLVTELVTDILEDSDDHSQRTWDLIGSQPHCRKDYDQLVTEIGWLNQRPAGIGITIFLENREFDSVTFTRAPGSKSIENIVPGHYRIILDTGRLIWAGEFTERDLLWTNAFPGRALQLAADTANRKGNPTRSVSGLEGEITIRIFAGIESGRIEITLNASGDVK